MRLDADNGLVSMSCRYLYASNTPLQETDPSGLWPISVTMNDKADRTKKGSCPQWHSKLITTINMTPWHVKKLGMKPPYDIYVFQQFSFVCRSRKCECPGSDCRCQCDFNPVRNDTQVWELLGGKAKKPSAIGKSGLAYTITDNHGYFNAKGNPVPQSRPDRCEDRVCNSFDVNVHLRVFSSLPRGAKANWKQSSISVNDGCFNSLDGNLKSTKPGWWAAKPWAWYYYSYTVTNECCYNPYMDISKLTHGKTRTW